MKIVTPLFVIALAVGIDQFASGQGRSQANQVQARRDQLRIAAQAICPVSGQRLGDHGTPIKVTVGKAKQQVFLCCKGCLGKRIDSRHWTTIHANFARTQRTCPVMKKPLPKNSRLTIVEGQIVYVCCPPCTKKVAAKPKAYLQQVDALYTASLRTRRVRR